MKKQSKAERKSRDKGNLSAFRTLPRIVRDSEGVCVACGAPVPEGRQICPVCQATAWGKSVKEGLI